MENGRLVELVSDMLDEMKEMNRRFGHLTDRVDHLTDRVDEMAGDIRIMKEDIAGLKKGQAKTNMAIHELRLSILRLADAVAQIPELDRRLTKVEAVVFKQ